MYSQHIRELEIVYATAERKIILYSRECYPTISSKYASPTDSTYLRVVKELKLTHLIDMVFSDYVPYQLCRSSCGKYVKLREFKIREDKVMPESRLRVFK